MNSYWNPKSKVRAGKNIFNRTDILFADMFSNTQNIYKTKKVIPDSEYHHKVKIFFGSLLEQNRAHILPYADQSKRVIDILVDNGELYYCDYQWLRKLEQN